MGYAWIGTGGDLRRRLHEQADGLLEDGRDGYPRRLAVAELDPIGTTLDERAQIGR
jgi:hypothetical protein